MHPVFAMCMTCQSRLRVRSAEIMGQIVACPKCGSMVKIDIPSDGRGKVDNGPDAAALDSRWRGETTGSRTAAVQDEPGDAVPFDAPTERDESAAGISVCMATSAVVTSEHVVTVRSQPNVEATPAADGREPWWRGGLLHGAVATLGVVFGVVAAGWLSQDWGATSSDPPRLVSAELVESKPIADATDSLGDIGQNDAATGVPTTNSSPIDGPLTALQDQTPSGDVATEPPDSPPTLQLEATDGVAVSDAIGARPTQDARTIVVAKIPVAETLPPTRTSATQPTIALPAPLEIDAPRRLLDPVASIQFKDAKLGDVLTFASEFSTVPITVEANALMQANISLSSRVSVDLKETTIGGVIRAAIQGFGLDYSLSGSYLVIHRASPPDSVLRVEKYDIGDLTRGQIAASQELLELMQQMVSPASWQPAGGIGTIRLSGDALIVQQDEPSHFEIIRLCEKLRVASGLRPRSRYPAGLFQMENRRQQANDLLNTTIRVRHSSPTSFGEIVQNLAKSAEAQILVDWPALEKEGWNPNLNLNISVERQPLRETLGELLNPMNLTYRAESSDTLVVTTRPAETTRMDVEFHDIGRWIDGPPEAIADLRNQVRAAVGGEQFASGRGGMAVYAPGRCLLVRLPQSKQTIVANFFATAK